MTYRLFIMDRAYSSWSLRGWLLLDAFGIEFGTFTDRFEKLEEALQIVIPMLRGERPTLNGERYTARDAMNEPPAVARIPVMIGGGGERKTLRMVAQYADESNIICPPADLQRKLDALAEHCDRLGRNRSDITVSWQKTACIAPTVEEAKADLGYNPIGFREGMDRSYPLPAGGASS